MVKTAAPEPGQLLTDLAVQQPIEKGINSKGGVGNPGDHHLPMPTTHSANSDRGVQVESKERQPAAQELSHNEDQGEDGLVASQKAIWDQPGQHQDPGSEDGHLAGDGVTSVCGCNCLCWHRRLLQGRSPGHTVDAGVDSKDNDGGQNEAGDAEEDHENLLMGPGAPVDCAAAGAGGPIAMRPRH